MGVIDSIRKAFRPGKWRLGGTGINQMIIPPNWSYQDYLQSYGNIGWLFRGASIIAYAVASEKWRLYKQKRNGEWDEIDQHPILELMDRVNAYQTRFEFMYLQTLYMVLVGESFTVLDFPRLTSKIFKNPTQMWAALPQRMAIRRDNPQDYFSYYEYQAGATKIRFEIPEVIPESC
jgi:phage portal protein BeeE